MKILIGFLTLFIFSPLVFAEAAHDHHHNESSQKELKLNNGKKWPTDTALRNNMDEIHNHIKAQLGKIQSDNFKDKEFIQLGKKIEKNVQNIFKSCKLEPKADAQLHIIMTGLIAENTKLIGELTAEGKKEATFGILTHYRSYLKFFDHTGKSKSKLIENSED